MPLTWLSLASVPQCPEVILFPSAGEHHHLLLSLLKPLSPDEKEEPSSSSSQHLKHSWKWSIFIIIILLCVQTIWTVWWSLRKLCSYPRTQSWWWPTHFKSWQTMYREREDNLCTFFIQFAFSSFYLIITRSLIWWHHFRKKYTVFALSTHTLNWKKSKYRAHTFLPLLLQCARPGAREKTWADEKRERERERTRPFESAFSTARTHFLLRKGKMWALHFYSGVVASLG